jgi:hypothetical protein
MTWLALVAHMVIFGWAMAGDLGFCFHCFFRSQIPLGYDENEVDGILQSRLFYCILNGLRELELLDARKERVVDEMC